MILSCYINSINCVININDAQNTMKAVVASAVASKEGDFSKISVKNISIPTPSPGEVLIKVAASSVNPVDWKILTGGLPLKFPHTLGFDVSGTVAQCNDCKRLKENDVVWADLGKTWLLRGGELGAYAEYALADEEQVGLKPNGIDKNIRPYKAPLLLLVQDGCPASSVVTPKEISLIPDPDLLGVL